MRNRWIVCILAILIKFLNLNLSLVYRRLLPICLRWGNTSFLSSYAWYGFSALLMFSLGSPLPLFSPSVYRQIFCPQSPELLYCLDHCLIASIAHLIYHSPI